MSDHTTTRRALLVASATVPLAGCLGGDGSSDGGRGEPAVEESVEDLRRWTFDLEEGETIAVEVAAEGLGADASIDHAENPTGGDFARTRVSAGETETIEHTADEALPVQVVVNPSEAATARIYV